MHRTCPQCDSRLEPDSIGGLCPRCLARDFLAPTDFDKGAPDADFPGLLEGEDDRRVGDYELLEELGRGGMGVVFRARQLSLGREVAVKFLLHGPLAGDAALARFRAEAEAAASLRHPNIVTTFEVGEDRGRLFHAMEFVPGRTLAEMTREGPLGCARAAAYVQRVAAAVHYAHERGVLHRDLKPANVLIDDQDEPRVTDFGLAKRLEPVAGQADLDPLTVTGQILGTPAYISPEQAAGHPVEARSDIYSLGALLYHLVTGRPPFVGESPTHVLRQVAETEPIAPALLNDAVPRDLQTICLKCLEKETARRYATARELADDLGRFLADEPIRARAVSAAERGWRWCKRKPALATALAGIAVLLVGIAVVSSLAARRIGGLRREALVNLYASDMRLAQQAIAESKFGVALDLLHRHQPGRGDPDLRGFEWWHFQELCRSEEAATLSPHTSQVQRVAFSPDGRLVASAGLDVQVWDTARHRRLFQFPIRDFVWSLAFSPDSRELLVGDSGGQVWRLDVSRQTSSEETVSLAAEALGHLGPIESRVIGFWWPPAGGGIGLVLPGGLRMWDGTKDQADQLMDFGMSLARAQPSADGRFASALTGVKRVVAWRLNPPQRIGEFDTPELLRATAISPDGSQLAAGGYAGALRVWSLRGDGRTNVIAAHRGLIETVAFSPDGRWLASAGADQIVRVHELATGGLTGEWRGHHATIMAVAFSPDGRWLVSGDRQGEVKLWDVGATRTDRQEPADAGSLLSTDGARVLTLTSDRSFNIRATSPADAPAQTGSFSKGAFLLLSARGLAAIGSDGGLATLETDGSWRTQALGGLRVLIGGALSPDGRIAALRVQDVAGVVVWDLATAREVLRTTNEPLWLSPTFSADSRRLAYGSPSGLVRVWELASGRLVSSFQAHRNYAYACDLSPDGRRLATAGFDGAVRLWETDGARLLGEYRSPADAYWTVALSPDGRRLAAGTSESSIVLWDVPSRQEVATLQWGQPLGPVEGTLRFAPDGTALLHVNGLVHRWLAPVQPRSNTANGRP